MRRDEDYALPDRFDDFEINDRLGSGAMGEVFLARQVSLEREVAIKLLSPAILGAPSALDRFMREGRVLAALRHPNIVPVLATGVVAARPYFVMERIAGSSLADLLATRPRLPVEDAFAIARDVARALEAAHSAGVVHRDVKPANILVEPLARDRARDLGEGASFRAFLVDFGLAYLAGESTLTRTGDLLGTPVFMAPEQARGEAADPRSDIYSLGATLYTMLSGEPPFEGSSSVEILRKIQSTDPPAIRRVQPDIDGDAETVCEMAMRWHPPARYISAGRFAEDIERRLDGKPVLARPPRAVYRLRLWARRHPIGAAGLAALVIVLLSVLLGVLRRNDRLAAAEAHLASGSVSEARALVRETLALPWPLADVRRMNIEFECALWRGALEEAAELASRLAESGHPDAARRLESIVLDQARAARRAAADDAAPLVRKLLREIQPVMAELGGAVRDEIAGLINDTVLVSLARGRRPERALSGQAEIRAFLDELSRDPVADPLVRPSERRVLSRAGLGGAGMDMEDVHRLLRSGRPAAEAALVPPALSSDVERVDPPAAEPGAAIREALTSFRTLDAYRHLFADRPDSGVDVEEVSNWIELLERLRPVGGPLEYSGTMELVADVNGDTRPEIIGVSSGGLVAVDVTARGLSSRALVPDWRGAAPTTIFHVAALDVLDSDGLELVVNHSPVAGECDGTTALSIFVREDAGTFRRKATHGSLPAHVRPGSHTIAAGDIDGDGDVDLIAALVLAESRKAWSIPDPGIDGSLPVALAGPDADIEAVLFADLDGTNGPEAVALTGHWHGYDVQVWPAGADRAIRWGPVGRLSHGIRIALHGDERDSLLVVKACYSVNKAVFPESPHAGSLEEGLHIARFPDGFHAEPTWTLEYAFPGPIRPDPGMLDSDFLSSLALDDKRTAVAICWTVSEPRGSCSFVDVLVERTSPATTRFTRHRLFRREDASSVRAAFVSGHAGPGSMGMVVVSQESSLDPGARSSAQLWEILPASEAAYAPVELELARASAWVADFFRVWRRSRSWLESGASGDAAKSVKERATFQWLWGAARDLAWKEAVAALEKSLEAGAAWRSLVTTGTALDQCAPLEAIPKYAVDSRGPLAAVDTLFSLESIDLPRALGAGELFRLTFRFRIDMLTHDSSIFVGIVRTEVQRASASQERHGCAIACVGGDGNSTIRPNIIWDERQSESTSKHVIAIGTVYDVIIELLADGRLALRVAESAAATENPRVFTAFDPPLAPSRADSPSPPATKHALEQGAYRLVIACKSGRDGNGSERRVRAEIRDVKLRVLER